LLDLNAQDDVLEDLVQGVSGMQTAIGIGGPIVKEELVVGRAIGGLPFIKVIGASLDVLLAVLRQRTRSEMKRVSNIRDAKLSGKTHGNVDLGSLSVDAQLFDIVSYKS
jgi:hypothetical protein